MRVLVTGGAGFIGSNLVEYLLKKECEVIVIDNLTSGFKNNIDEFMEDIEFYKNNIEDFNLSSLKKLDAIVHLAAQASVPLSIENFSQSSTSNLNGTINIIDYCKNFNVPLVYASSSAIYGNLPIGDDDDIAIDLISPYAADKYTMEIYTKLAHQIYDLSSIGLRFFNVYGPKQDPHSPYSGVISIFIERYLNLDPVIINGGHQTRDFVYIDDVIECIYQSIQIVKSKKVSKNINILTGKSISIDYLAERISKITNNDSKKIYKKLQPGDPIKSEGTSKTLRDFLLINNKNFTSIDEGLKKTITYIREA